MLLDFYIAGGAPAGNGTSLLAVLAAVAAAKGIVGLRQAALYGLAGSILFSALLMIPAAALDSALGAGGTLAGALASPAYVAGTSIGIALAPRRLRFQRTFEDGHTDELWVSARSRAFDRLCAEASEG